MNLAIIGSTGLVGKKMLEILEERNFPIEKIIPVASKKSEGNSIEFNRKQYRVISIENSLNEKIDIALFSAGAEVSLEWAPKFSNKGIYVIDNSSAWRMDDGVKLIIPEINGSLLESTDRIIANPNCSTIQLVTVLKPIHDAFSIKRVVVSTYQSTSGAGKKAMDELFNQTLDVYKNKHLKQKIFTKRIAFNLIPHIDKFLDDL